MNNKLLMAEQFFEELFEPHLPTSDGISLNCISCQKCIDEVPQNSTIQAQNNND